MKNLCKCGCGKLTSLDKALNTEELFDCSNGRTLCLSCHKQTDTYAKAFYNKYKYVERGWDRV
jgi:hypothetical protein